MATINSVFVPGTITNASLAAATAVEVDFAKYTKFAINATGDLFIRFGQAGLTAASATNGFRIPANSVAEFDLGSSLTAISLFNNGGGSITFTIITLLTA